MVLCSVRSKLEYFRRQTVEGIPVFLAIEFPDDEVANGKHTELTGCLLSLGKLA